MTDPADRSARRGKLIAYVLQSVRILAACGISYLFARLFDLKEEYWALITSIVVMQPGFSETLVASRNRILGTLIGAGTGFMVVEAVQYGLPQLPLFWCALVPLAVLTAVWPNLRLSCVTLVVVVLIPSAGPAFERPLDRVFGILVGVISSIIVSTVIRTTSPQS